MSAFCAGLNRPTKPIGWRASKSPTAPHRARGHAAATGCLVDWQRLPADDQDLHARLSALAERATRHPAAPVIDEYGEITCRGTTVFLSRVDERIAKILIEHLGHPVPADELVSRVWTDNGTNENLRVHISRLRHHLAPLALAITNIRDHGYVMTEAETSSTTQRQHAPYRPHRTAPFV